jgi:flagellar basal-body rod modification protein FlgD
VRTIQMTTQQNAGVQTYEWDGRADDGSPCPDGNYTIGVTASAGADPVTADTLTIARVNGVVPGNNGTLLQLAGLGIVDLAQVLQIN